MEQPEGLYAIDLSGLNLNEFAEPMLLQGGEGIIDLIQRAHSGDPAAQAELHEKIVIPGWNDNFLRHRKIGDLPIHRLAVRPPTWFTKFLSQDGMRLTLANADEVSEFASHLWDDTKTAAVSSNDRIDGGLRQRLYDGLIGRCEQGPWSIELTRGFPFNWSHMRRGCFDLPISIALVSQFLDTRTVESEGMVCTGSPQTVTRLYMEENPPSSTDTITETTIRTVTMDWETIVPRIFKTPTVISRTWAADYYDMSQLEQGGTTVWRVIVDGGPLTGCSNCVLFDDVRRCQLSSSQQRTLRYQKIELPQPPNFDLPPHEEMTEDMWYYRYRFVDLDRV